jgi:hypothetical protein
MIVIYPMLTSQDISDNAVSGICKTLEKFLIVYKLNDVLNNIQPSMKKEIIGKTIIGKENYNLDIENSDELFFENYENMYTNYILEAGNKRGPNYDSLAIAIADKLKDNMSQGDSSKNGKSDKYSKETFIDMPSKDDMSLSPTYIQVDTKTLGPKMIGVKVIPFKVKSEEEFIQLFIDDVERKKMNYKLVKYGRKTSRVFNKYLNKIGINKKTISGNVKQDVILAKSTFKDNTFVLFNYMNIKNSDVFKNPSTVKKLHKLNWGSFIIADDVNQRAFFCMKQFKGLCSLVQYRYMFEALTAGKGTYNNAYEDLQDIKKQSTPFFNIQKPSKRIFGESKADDKLLSYLKIIEEKKYNNFENNDILNEDMSSAIKAIKNKLNFNKLFQKLGSKNKKDQLEAVKVIPNVSFNKIEKMGYKASPEFKKQYEFAKNVVNNSTELNESKAKSVAIIAALGAIITEDPDKNIRPILKQLIESHQNKNIKEDATIVSAKQELSNWLFQLILDVKNIIVFTFNQLGQKITTSTFGKLDKYKHMKNSKGVKFKDVPFMEQIKLIISKTSNKTKIITVLVIILLVLGHQIYKEGEED